jgi:hypothetical protein
MHLILVLVMCAVTALVLYRMVASPFVRRKPPDDPQPRNMPSGEPPRITTLSGTKARGRRPF